RLQIVSHGGQRGRVLGWTPGEHEEDGLVDDELGAILDVEEGAVGRQVERPAAPVYLEASRGLAPDRRGAAVVRTRIEVDPHGRMSTRRAKQAHDRDRDAHADAFGDAGREVEDLPAVLAVVEAGARHVRVGEVLDVPRLLARPREEAEGPTSLG